MRRGNGRATFQYTETNATTEGTHANVVPGSLHYVDVDVTLSPSMQALHPPFLQILAAAGGSSAGALMLFAAPRLLAYRFPARARYAPALVLIPLAGTIAAGWRILYSLGVQVLVAALTGAMAYRFGSSRTFLAATLYSMLLVAMALVDVEHRLIPNRLTYPGIVLALAGGTLWPGIGIRSALGGTAIALLISVALRFLSPDLIGIGDTKMALVVGAMRGFPGVLGALLVSAIIAGLVAVVVVVVWRQQTGSNLAYGPFLSAGVIVSILLSPT